MTQQVNDSIQAIRAVENTLQHHMMHFGYKTIDLPIIDEAETFLTRAGAGIMERLFTFERGGKLLALRPEFTAVAAHRYVQEAHTNPVRWQMSGSIFEDEASDVSTQYRRHNIGAELIGTSAIASDAEIIAMAVQGVDKLAISGWELVIGHVGLQLHLLSRYQLDKRTARLLMTQRERLQREGVDAVLAQLNTILMMDADTELPADEADANGQTQHMLDVLLDSTRYGSTMGGRTRHDIASRVLKKHSRGLERDNIRQALAFLYAWGQFSGEPTEILSRIRSLIDDDDTTGLALFDELDTMLSLLDVYGIPSRNIVLQPDLTRNWDYYTGVVFGIRADDTYIASGGRYDGLTQLLGADDAFPAVGFAYYTERMLPFVDAEETQHTYTLSAENDTDAIHWLTALRAVGIFVVHVEMDAEIVVSGNSAQFNNSTYTQDELLEEVSA